MKTQDEIQKTLHKFQGSDHFYSYSSGLHLTEGVLWLAEAAQCHWLLDIVVSTQSVQKVKAAELQIHKLKVNLEKKSGDFSVVDGDGRKLYTQHIDYTNFPLPEITLWQTGGIIMLPSEY